MMPLQACAKKRLYQYKHHSVSFIATHAHLAYAARFAPIHMQGLRAGISILRHVCRVFLQFDFSNIVLFCFYSISVTVGRQVLYIRSLDR